MTDEQNSRRLEMMDLAMRVATTPLGSVEAIAKAARFVSPAYDAISRVRLSDSLIAGLDVIPSTKKEQAS